MRPIYFLLFLFLFDAATAAVHTSTHTYILGRHDDKLLVIDRVTNEEKLLDVGRDPKSFHVYEGTGYVVTRDDQSLTVIDLLTHTILKKITLPGCPYFMTIAMDKGYVLCDSTNYMQVVNLKTNEVIKKMLLGAGPQNMVVYKHYGFVPCYRSNNVIILDLSSDEEVASLQGPFQPIHIKVYGSKGFVIGGGSFITIIDLEQHKVIENLHIPNCFYDFVIDGDFGYGLMHNSAKCDPQVIKIDLRTHQHAVLAKFPNNSKSMCIYRQKGYILFDNSMKLYVIALDSGKVRDSFCFSSNLDSMVVHKEQGFLCTRQEIVVIDLEYDVVIARMSPAYRGIDFSDTHMFRGVERSNYALPMYFFDEPYSGIFGPVVGDPDTAYAEFNEACLRRETVKAKRYFEEALALGHPKAYAIAAYAFLCSKFGAVDNSKDSWYAQFLKDADKAFFRSLVQSEGSIIFSPDEELAAEINRAASLINKLTETEKAQLFKITS